ncbi:hypothetical protein L861_04200 [Litchfieldella anticariensis FP35 = DSM 16096]|uniref:Flagellar hook-length control protein-like C-terminal domain-containing protein n=1 Tax=Litchfieldella anticariensis (strain DSM 16096 / CECT 5854 / CIP 108499 / LMG 22089 / FP35) TaxID=1121939 RepID=S2LIS7_LITA3|nr:flagellar hook-length control protein FliK [Halomonas anticariensis]EPC04531.1 hypothetical protein L861_04200 [Halomonas anticariensis FP35 = DSM 16096]
MDITAILTTAAQSTSASNDTKSTGPQVDEAFSRLFDQASANAKLSGGRDLKNALAESVAVMTDVQTGVQTTEGQVQQQASISALAPLSEGIAQASAMLTQPPVTHQTLEELEDILNADVALQGAPLIDVQLPIDEPLVEQKPLASIRERMNLIDHAGQLNGASPALAAEIPIDRNQRTAGQQVAALSSGSSAGPETSRQTPPASPLTELHAGSHQDGSRGDASRYQALNELRPLATQAPSGTSASLSSQTPLAPPQAETIMHDASFASQLGKNSELAAHSGKETQHHLAGVLNQTQSGAQAGSLTAASTTTPSVTPGGVLPAPMTSPQWSQQLGQQLIGLHQRGGQQIELHLNPAELGPLSVSLKVTEHGAQAQFLSAHAQVRTAIEQAIPQLREALEEQGISLGEAMVGEHPQQQQQEQPAFAGNPGMQASGINAPQGGETQGNEMITPLHDALDGRVDLYA